MLSRAEILFLNGEKQVSESYAHKLRERIRTKAKKLPEELAVMALDPKVRLILDEAFGRLDMTEIRHAKTEELAGPLVSIP